MTAPLPVEQRSKIINAYNNNIGTVESIAEMFDVSIRSVYRYVQQYEETGSLEPLPLPGRPPILTDMNLNIIKNIVLTKKDGTLEEYKEAFYKKTGIEVTIVTIHNACKTLDLRRKKKVFSRKNNTDQMFRKKDLII